MDFRLMSGWVKEYYSGLITHPANGGDVSLIDRTSNLRILSAVIIANSPFPADSTCVRLQAGESGGNFFDLINAEEGAAEHFNLKGSQVAWDGGQAGFILPAEGAGNFGEGDVRLFFEGTGPANVEVLVYLRYTSMHTPLGHGNLFSHPLEGVMEW